MEKVKLTENMVAVLKVLAELPEGKGFARQVLAKMEGKTFNVVNATLAAAAGKGLVSKARKINEAMKMAAAAAIASLVSDEELNPEYIIPSTFDDRVAPAVAANVARVAIETGVARKTDITPEMVAEHTRQLVGSNK